MATQIFYIFTPTWGNDPFWRAYFSNGLVQPPTSTVSMFTTLRIFVRWLWLNTLLPKRSWKIARLSNVCSWALICLSLQVLHEYGHHVHFCWNMMCLAFLVIEIGILNIHHCQRPFIEVVYCEKNVHQWLQTIMQSLFRSMGFWSPRDKFRTENPELSWEKLRKGLRQGNSSPSSTFEMPSN